MTEVLIVMGGLSLIVLLVAAVFGVIRMVVSIRCLERSRATHADVDAGLQGQIDGLYLRVCALDDPTRIPGSDA